MLRKIGRWGGDNLEIGQAGSMWAEGRIDRRLDEVCADEAGNEGKEGNDAGHADAGRCSVAGAASARRVGAATSASGLSAGAGRLVGAAAGDAPGGTGGRRGGDTSGCRKTGVDGGTLYGRAVGGGREVGAAGGGKVTDGDVVVRRARLEDTVRIIGREVLGAADGVVNVLAHVGGVGPVVRAELHANRVGTCDRHMSALTCENDMTPMNEPMNWFQTTDWVTLPSAPGRLLE